MALEANLNAVSLRQFTVRSSEVADDTRVKCSETEDIAELTERVADRSI